jgi:hypothetical protein
MRSVLAQITEYFSVAVRKAFPELQASINIGPCSNPKLGDYQLSRACPPSHAAATRPCPSTNSFKAPPWKTPQSPLVMWPKFARTSSPHALGHCQQPRRQPPRRQDRHCRPRLHQRLPLHPMGRPARPHPPSSLKTQITAIARDGPKPPGAAKMRLVVRRGGGLINETRLIFHPPTSRRRCTLATCGRRSSVLKGGGGVTVQASPSVEFLNFVATKLSESITSVDADASNSHPPPRLATGAPNLECSSPT